MKIRGKIISGISGIIIGFIFTILVVYYNNQISLKSQDTAMLASQAKSAFWALESEGYRVLYEGSSLEKSREDLMKKKEIFELALKAFNEAEGKDYLDAEVHKQWDLINKLWVSVDELLKKIYGDIGILIPVKALDYDFKIKGINGVISAPDLTRKEVREAQSILKEIQEDLRFLLASSGEFAKALDKTIVALDKAIENSKKMSVLYSAGVVLLTTILAILFAFLFSGYVSGKIVNIQSILKSLSEKDLTVNAHIQSRDEFKTLGVYLNAVITALQEFIESAGGSVEKVNEIKEVLSSGTEESVAALNQITKNIESMTSQFKKLDQHIDESSRDVSAMDEEITSIVSAIDSQSEAVSMSSTAIEEMTASVSSIAHLTNSKQETSKLLLDVVSQGGEFVENTFDNIKSVYEELNDIKGLVEIIKDVADKTNILSMNAAIESAHAGDAGKGFSVVADEIRGLAESTGDNVKDINSAITSISTRIESALKASEESSEMFNTINRDISEFMNAMIEISGSLNELEEGNREVLSATEQVYTLNTKVLEGAGKIKSQSAMIETSMKNVRVISGEVTTGMTEVSTGTEEVLASFSDISDVTLRNSERIEDLKEKMNQFRTYDSSSVNYSDFVEELPSHEEDAV